MAQKQQTEEQVISKLMENTFSRVKYLSKDVQSTVENTDFVEDVNS